MTEQDNIAVQRLLEKYKTLGIFTNNLSTMYWAKKLGRKLIISDKLNIFNAKALKIFQQFTDKIILSSELNAARIKYIAKQNANFFVTKTSKSDLIELNHCPMQENFGGNCQKCNYSENITYTNSANQTFLLKRKKLSDCHFRLVSGIISVRGDDYPQCYFNFENYTPAELKAYFEGTLTNTNRGFESRTV